MRARILALGIAVAGCGDPAIDLTLRLPTGEGADVDLSCVAAVRVYAWGHDLANEPPNTCVTLDAPVATFAALRDAVRGKVDLALPLDGLAGVEVAGLTTADCLGGDAVFYGGAEYTGGDLTIPLAASADCAARQPLTVHPVDFIGLAATGACGSAATRLDRGSIHPTMLDAPLPAMVYDLSGPSATVDAAGTATFPDALLAVGGPEACTAVGDPQTGSIGCVHPGAPGVCAPPGQAELTTIDFDFADQSLDSTAALRYPQIVFGAVWDAVAAPPHPIAGARVEVQGDPDAAEVHYASMAPAGMSLVETPGAQATGAGGLFIGYMDRATTVTVAAPGYYTRSITLVAADFVFGAETIALTPMP